MFFQSLIRIFYIKVHQNNFGDFLNNQIDYDINSYLSNDQLPDLYTPLGMIKGDNYKIIPYKGNKDNNDKRENKYEKIKNNNDSNYIGKFNSKNNKKIKRYFDIDFDEENDDIKKVSKNKNISISNSIHTSCKKCGCNNSLKCDCLTIRTFCYICLGKSHIKKNCPRLQKCFKCLKYGHKANNCNESLNNKCENCNISIHNKEECLKCPDKILIKDLKENNLKCRVCGSEEHLICKFYNREDIILGFNSNDKDKDKSNHDFNKSCVSLHNSNNSNLNNLDDKGKINIYSGFSSWENGTEESFNISNDTKNEFNNSYINTNLSTINSNINDYNNNSEYNAQNIDKKVSNYNNLNINNHNYCNKNINNDNCFRKRNNHNNNEKGNNNNKYNNNYISLKEDEANEDKEFGSNSYNYYN